MGKRGTRRRNKILERVREELQAHGVEIYMADNEEKPFIFGKERTRFLNRVKITLNLTRTWYDENLMRFAIAAPNRTMIISEPLLPHYPEVKPGIHYVSAPIDKLAETIIYYLEHDEQRHQIVDNAYQLSTTILTFHNSIKSIMDGVDQFVSRSAGKVLR
jgi:spore maturation protein CgeB